MASSRKRVRLSLVIEFDSLDGKNVFKRRFDHVRKVLTPAGQSDLDNYGLMSAILDHMERMFPPASFPGVERANTQFSSGVVVSTVLTPLACWGN